LVRAHWAIAVKGMAHDCSAKRSMILSICWSMGSTLARGIVDSAGVLERGKGTGWITWEPVRVLRVVPDSAEYWDTRGNSMIVALKLAASRLSGNPPNLGENEKVRLP
jgi:hypothetical protein